MYRPNKEYLYTKYEAHCKECGIYILHIIYKNDYKNHFYIFNKEKMEITSNVTIKNKFIKLRYGKIRSGYGSSEEEKDYLYNLSESEIEENRRRYDDELDNAVIKYKEKFGYTDMSKIEIEHIIKEIDLDDEFIENRLV